MDLRRRKELLRGQCRTIEGCDVTEIIFGGAVPGRICLITQGDDLRSADLPGFETRMHCLGDVGLSSSRQNDSELSGVMIYA